MADEAQLEKADKTYYQFSETLDFFLLPFSAFGGDGTFHPSVLQETLAMILELRIFRLTEPLRVQLVRLAETLEGRAGSRGPMFHRFDTVFEETFSSCLKAEQMSLLSRTKLIDCLRSKAESFCKKHYGEGRA